MKVGFEGRLFEVNIEKPMENMDMEKCKKCKGIYIIIYI